MNTRFSILLIVAGLTCAAANASAKVETYDLKKVIEQVYARGGNQFKPIQRDDEPIGQLAIPVDSEMGVSYLTSAVRGHVAVGTWGLSGNHASEITKSDRTSMTVNATDDVHASIKKFLIALTKPIKLNPKAKEEEFAKKAVLTDKESGMITIVYTIEAFPVFVAGITIERARTTRSDIVQGLTRRIQQEVTPEDWSSRGDGNARVTELSGRLIVTHSAKGHIELAKKLAEWVK